MPTAAASAPTSPRRRLAWSGAALLLLLGALPWWLLLPSFGRLPNNDYYIVLDELLSPDGDWRVDPALWATVRSNEHRVTVPALLYAANVTLTDGDSRGLSALSLLALLATAAILLGRLPPPLPDSGGGILIGGALLAGLLFAPAQAHSIVLGFSGTIWLTANLVAVAAIAAFDVHLRTGRRSWLLAALALAGTGFVTYSTTIMLWPALLLAAVLLRRWRLAVVLAAAGATVLALSAFGYQRPHGHPELATGDPLGLTAFALRYLGNPWAAEGRAALLVGAVGVAASAALWSSRALHRRELLPWALLQIYALGNALGTGVGRGGIAVDYSLSSRYATVGVLFWAGLLLPAAAVAAGRWGDGARAGRFVAAALGVAALAAAPLWWRGAPVLAENLRRAEAEGVAEAALLLDVRHRAALLPVTQSPPALLRLRDRLRSRGHVPFDRPPPAELGSSVAASASGPARWATLRHRRRVAGGEEVGGWTAGGRPRLRWLALVGAGGRVCGLGAPGLPARQQEPGSDPNRRLPWTGYLVGCSSQALRALALEGERPQWRPVEGGGWNEPPPPLPATR
jgi:hypothetical protein